MATLQDQLRWETYQRDLGRTKLEQQLRKAEEKGRIADTPLGSSVLRRYVLWMSERLSKDITEDLGKAGRSKAYSPLLHALDPDAVSLLAITTLIESVCQRKEGMVHLGWLSSEIGRRVYGELALASFRDINPELYEALTKDLQTKMSQDLRHKLTVFRMQAQKAGIELPEWTPSQKAQVGSYLVSLMEKQAGDHKYLCELDMVQMGNKSAYVVHLSEHVHGIMAEMEDRLMLKAGFAAPCLIPPQPWDAEGTTGGFYGDLKVRAVRFFKGSSTQWEIMRSEGHDPSVVLGMLDAVQNVAWKVNPFILDLIKQMRAKGLETKTVRSTAALPKPERPLFLDLQDGALSEEQEAIKKAWKRQMRDWHTEVRKVSRIEARLAVAIAAADEMLKHDRFYFAHQVCDRFRMYPVSGPLSPQGADNQKALLHSADGGPVDTPEALYWFKLNIAAKFGIDKLSPEDCIKWVDDNETNIIRAASDPAGRDAFHWWSQADKPLQFIAVCDEYRRYLLDPTGFVARIACAMDGTCNGLQNYSALLRDDVGGKATNLVSADTGVPNDIYGDVAKAAHIRLLQSGDSPEKGSWLEHGFNRKLTKPSVMTQVYGSTFGTCRKSILSYCIENALFEGEEYQHADFAGKLVWAGIDDVVVKAKEAMKWLRDAAGAVMREGAEYITWLAPSGARVVQIYNKHDELRVWTHVGNKIRLQLRGPEHPDKPDKMRHRNAFPPNFIHSVDASHMALVAVRMVKEFGRGVFLHLIHDDFGALPHQAAALARVIREEFVAMHESYSLDKIREQYPFLAPTPEKGTLDVKCVLDSVNFFR
ncbi:putative DNA-dependent RNA polymerase [Aeromonas phage ZPAH7B]|uniref:DNA-directed RNA polymerase n=2 Tax=Aerosvirus ZPAH7 TaxID=2733366 RepID=A0A3Q9GFM6_9CAUD|nr:putative DNA-dependent RNA polymerase [Aeromonas phage ZPAH7]AZQ96400.1 putative DNA-dependent RNA polymerase [Aeromonas phage ZPAH7]QAX95980.1 putative DNA-dependent RNA polymerase [Aeromonas phage ZPAH7B]